MVSCMAWNPYIHLRIRLSRAKIYGYDVCVELVLDFEEDLFQMRDSLDRFYTNIDIASHCIDILTDTIGEPLLDYVVEPSAGSGSFSALLRARGSHVIAFDIVPTGEWIIGEDFLSVTAEDTDGVTVFVGNPPFGERSATAKRFISKCIELGADVIAFILPNTFNKLTMQRVFPSGWRLVSATRLPKDSFHTPDGNGYGVPTSFFIWTVRDDISPDTDLRARKYPVPPDWSYARRGDGTADLCINGNSGKVRKPSEITNPKAEHFIRGSDVSKEGIAAVASVFEKARGEGIYRNDSSVNGGNYWIDRNELNRAYGEAKARMDS